MIRISKTAIFIGLFIIVSASFTRQLFDFLKSYIGEAGFIAFMGLIFMFCGLAFLIFVVKNKLGFIKSFAILLLLIVGLTVAWKMKIPQERIHILEYGLLGWFAGRDLIERNRKIRGIILAGIFTATVGIIDELFQAILPYRVFDLRDIVFNSLGGIWGVILYLLRIKQ